MNIYKNMFINNRRKRVTTTSSQLGENARDAWSTG